MQGCYRWRHDLGTWSPEEAGWSFGSLQASERLIHFIGPGESVGESPVCKASRGVRVDISEHLRFPPDSTSAPLSTWVCISTWGEALKSNKELLALAVEKGKEQGVSLPLLCQQEIFQGWRSNASMRGGPHLMTLQRVITATCTI